MSSFCPLCRKNKLEEALFCEQCSKKIQADYEVDIPKSTQHTGTSEKTDDVPPKPAVVPETKPKIDRKKLLIGASLVVLLVIGGFFLFNNADGRQSAQAEQVAWETAVSGNTIAHFLAFIEAHPRSEKTDLARENILRLRQSEAEKWETLRRTNNISELRNFLEQFPESSIEPLVRNRIDSLTWAATERGNP